MLRRITRIKMSLVFNILKSNVSPVKTLLRALECIFLGSALNNVIFMLNVSRKPLNLFTEIVQ